MNIAREIADNCTCPICLETFSNAFTPLTFPCGHHICSDCSANFRTESGDNFEAVLGQTLSTGARGEMAMWKCPMCRAECFTNRLPIDRMLLFFSVTLAASSPESVAASMKQIARRFERQESLSKAKKAVTRILKAIRTGFVRFFTFCCWCEAILN